MAVNMFNKYLTLIVFTSCFGECLYMPTSTRYIIINIYNNNKTRLGYYGSKPPFARFLKKAGSGRIGSIYIFSSIVRSI